MGAQGTATLDFGTFPGKTDTYVDVAATGVISTSLVEAWIRPVATADHTADEHMVETLKVFGVYLSDNNIRIHGFNTSQLIPPEEPVAGPHEGRGLTGSGQVRPRTARQPTPMLVGQFNVSWVWN